MPAPAKPQNQEAFNFSLMFSCLIASHLVSRGRIHVDLPIGKKHRLWSGVGDVGGHLDLLVISLKINDPLADIVVLNGDHSALVPDEAGLQGVEAFGGSIHLGQDPLEGGAGLRRSLRCQEHAQDNGADEMYVHDFSGVTLRRLDPNLLIEPTYRTTQTL